MKRSLPELHGGLIIKFKCGVLPIAIETGRNKDTLIKVRKCVICNTYSIESEVHFPTACEAFKPAHVIHLRQPNGISNISTLSGMS